MQFRGRSNLESLLFFLLSYRFERNLISSTLQMCTLQSVSYSVDLDVHVHKGNVVTQSILKDANQNSHRAEKIRSIFPIMLIQFARFGFIDTWKRFQGLLWKRPVMISAETIILRSFYETVV